MERPEESKTPCVEWGVAERAMAGQDRSGDRFVVQTFPQGILIGVVDGLGHGASAADAAELAISTLQTWAHEPVISLLKRCHEALRSTRGVVMSLASLHTRDNRMTWLSVGNVEGVLLRAEAGAGREREYVLPRGGVVGYRLPPLRTADFTIRPGDLLIFATDGIHSRFMDGLARNAPPQQIADRILAEHGKATDDALVLVARYLGGAS